MLEEFKAQIESETPDSQTALANLARASSDCSSAKNGGDLGFFPRGAMQRPFEDATFALEVGQMSGIVETASGLHLIIRTG
jgi:NIMA-interacting peptidyl-prolyl cis-trans isomerase 1